MEIMVCQPKELSQTHVVPLDALFTGRAVEDWGLKGEASAPAGLAGVIVPNDWPVANGLPQVMQVPLNVVR